MNSNQPLRVEMARMVAYLQTQEARPAPPSPWPVDRLVQLLRETDPGRKGAP